MDPFVNIVVWVLASVLVSLVAGFYLGRSGRLQEQSRIAANERQSALDALLELLKSVEDLTSDVDTRSSEIRAVHSQVGDLQLSGELETVRQVLLRQVATVLESNQKLEDDLVYARCRMEHQAEELDRTRQEAHLDALTGVANRKAFDEKLLVLLGALRRGGEPFALVLADMDHFKWINDTHGHLAGDTVLRELGALLKRCVREGDFVARYGGDEFAILMPRADMEVGRRIADRLRLEATRTNFGLGDLREAAAATLSIGVTTALPSDTQDSILERTDLSLYAAKRSGRNQVQIGRPADPGATSTTPPADAPGATLSPQARALATADRGDRRYG